MEIETKLQLIIPHFLKCFYYSKIEHARHFSSRYYGTRTMSDPCCLYCTKWCQPCLSRGLKSKLILTNESQAIYPSWAASNNFKGSSTRGWSRIWMFKMMSMSLYGDNVGLHSCFIIVGDRWFFPSDNKNFFYNCIVEYAICQVTEH